MFSVVFVCLSVCNPGGGVGVALQYSSDISVLLLTDGDKKDYQANFFKPGFLLVKLTSLHTEGNMVLSSS